jgi:hypothetical protein
MSNNQKFYDLVETFISENEEKYSLLEKDEAIKIEHADELEEMFESEDYSIKDLKEYLKDNLITNEEYAEEEFGVDIDNFGDMELIAKDLGMELKYVCENYESWDVFKGDLKEFVEYMFEIGLFKDTDEQLINMICNNQSMIEDIWERLLKYDYSEVEKLGYVFTSF